MEAGKREAQIIGTLFESATGQQLGEERSWRIGTTLTPLCKARDIGSLAALVARLEEGRDEPLRTAVVDALLNNETSFFRDAAAFRQLADEILPELARQRAHTKRLRIWSAACSTGQEAYSLAMLFAQDAVRWRDWTIDILGTDISRSAVARARAGLYSAFEVQRGLPVRQLVAGFNPVLDRGWQIRPELARMVRFGHHDLLAASPAGSAFDLILCRNALLYFTSDRRRRVLEGLAGAIAADGALMLGAGETPGDAGSFVADPRLLTIFRPTALMAKVPPRPRAA